MRRYAVLLALLLGCLYWFEPWLRQVNVAEAEAYPWLPVLDHGIWNAVVLVTLALAAFVALIVLIKFGLFVWRELGD
jgi:hypothetical protein